MTESTLRRTIYNCGMNSPTTLWRIYSGFQLEFPGFLPRMWLENFLRAGLVQILICVSCIALVTTDILLKSPSLFVQHVIKLQPSLSSGSSSIDDGRKHCIPPRDPARRCLWFCNLELSLVRTQVPGSCFCACPPSQLQQWHSQGFVSSSIGKSF